MILPEIWQQLAAMTDDVMHGGLHTKKGMVLQVM